MRIIGMRAVQAKRNGETRSLQLSRAAANLASRGRLDGVATEALAPQPGGRLRAWAKPGDELSRPVALRGDRRERVDDRARVDSVLLQQVPDPCVAVPSLGERLGPRLSVTPVVDVPDALECFERLRPLRLVHTGARKPLVELLP